MTLIPVTADALTDDSTIINAALADPAITTVELPAGVVGVGSAIVIPSGKTLMGAGRELTTLLALPSFSQNVVVTSALRAVGVYVHDLTIDADRRGSGGGLGRRVNGLQMPYARRFTVRRVDVRNCTGYGHYVVGDTDNLQEMAGDGTWEDCRAANCEVHFEQMFAENITLINCHSRDGEGDVSCQSWFHPLTGSRDITYIGCTARGIAGAGIEATANVRDLERIRFIGCDVHVRGTTTALITSAGVGRTSRLELIGTRIHSDGGVGAQLHDTEAFATQSWISGAVEGLQLSNNSSLVANGLELLGVTDPASGGSAIGINVDASSRARFTGGRIEARGPVGRRLPLYGATANVETSESTEIAGQTRYFKLMESYGMRPIAKDGSNTAYVTIQLPNPVTNRDRAHLDFTIRRNGDGYLADRVTASWAFLDSRNVRVRLIGDATLPTTAMLSFHFVEWGERS
jgi:hypothetical protein